MSWLAARVPALVATCALGLSVACSSGSGGLECRIGSDYPFSGFWQPVDSGDNHLCLNQTSFDRVVGTHGSGEIVGVINSDGTLYLADERFPATVRVLTLSGDTLTQTALATSSGRLTETVKWARQARQTDVSEEW